MRDIFLVFLKLGLTSFGGPVAHLGYFRSEFVERRGWLDEAAYAELVALAQFLPGPSSSQVGMSIGLLRGGIAGMFAAWFAFTMPSVLLLILFALAAGHLAAGVIQGLMLVAVAVVAQAVMQMARALTPDGPRIAIAVAACALLLFFPVALAQIAVLVAGGLLGWLVLASPPPLILYPALAVPVSRRMGTVLIILFFVLLGLLPLLAAHGGEALRLADSFYRAGALVFGGGHVVLPLLEADLVPQGLIARETFFAGYGAAQAMPGPLFSFAAFVGFAGVGGGLGHAALCLVAMFGSSFLLVPGVLPFWVRLSTFTSMRAAVMGLNAAVVGLLGAALITPVFTSTVRDGVDLAVVAAVFAVLLWGRVPVWLVVLAAGAVGFILGC